MSLLHPRYRRLRRAHAQVISLIFAGIFVVSLLLSTLVFNISFRWFQNTITTIERNLDRNITWDGISIHPNGTITISNLHILESTSNKNIATIENIAVKINFQRLQAYLFRPYEDLIEYDKTRIKKKDLQYAIVKSLTAVSLSGMMLNIEVPEDIAGLKTMFQYFFERRILPEHATLSIEHANGVISLLKIQATLPNTNVHLLITDTNGISGTYATSVQSTLFTNDIHLQIEGQMKSNPQSLFSISYKNTLSSIGINDFVTLRPFTLQFNTSEGKMDIVLENNNKFVTIRGTFDDHILQVDIDISDVMITQLLNIKDQALLKHIKKERVYGTGKFRFNSVDNTAAYQFSLNNVDKTNSVIAIDISGDERTLYTHNSTISIYNQYFLWDGSLSLENISLSGTIAYDFSKPIVDIPIKGKLLFTRDDFHAIAKSEFLYINNVQQAPIRIEYNTILQRMEWFFNNQSTPSLSFTKIDNTYTDNQFDLHIRGREYTSAIVVQIHAFTPVFLDNIFFNNEKLHVFSNLSFTGKAKIVLQQHMSLETLQFDLGLEYNSDLTDYVQLKGNYSKQSGWNLAGNFQMPTLGQLKGNFSLLYPSQYAVVQNFTAVLQVSNQNNAHITYHLDGDISNKNKMSFSLNDALFTTVNVQDNLTTIRSRITNLHFIEPSLTLSGRVNIGLLSSGTLNTVDGTLMLQDDGQQMFSVTMDYRDKHGSISNIYWNIQERIFSGKGDITVNPKNQSIDVSLQEIRDQSTSKETLLSDDTIESYHISYDIKNKLLNMSLKSMPLQYIFHDYSGAVDANVMILGDFSRVNVEISKGNLIAKKQEGHQYQISGNLVYTPGRYEVYDLDISDKKQKLSIENASLENDTKLFAHFYVQSLQYAHIIPSLGGKITFESDQPILKSIQGLLSNDMDIDTKILIPDFTSTLLITPYYRDGRTIPSQYTHSIVITGKNQDIIARDTLHSLYVIRNANGKIYGEFGTPQQQVLFASFSGSFTRDTINVTMLINRADIKQLFDDFNIVSVASIDISNLLFQGRLFFRGTLVNPTIWGTLAAQNVDIKLSALFSDIQIPTVAIRFSDNDINIQRTRIVIDGSVLNLTGIGRLINGGLEYINFDFFTLDNDYITFRKLAIGAMQISGSTRGRLLLNIDSSNIFLGGTLYIKDTQLSVDNIQQEKTVHTPDSLFSTRLFTVSIKAISEEGVLYTWPSSNFPILRGYLKQNQSILFDFDSDKKFLYMKGNIKIDNGTLYYLDKGFNIKEGAVYFDSYENTVPYLENFVAVENRRYKNGRYTVTISAQNTFLNDLQFTINSTPPLSPAELSSLMGQGFTPVQETAAADTPSNHTLVALLGKIADPLVNIGMFSQVEKILTRSLRLDYISFRSKIVENLLVYSIANSNGDTLANNINSPSNQGVNYFLPYLLNQSSFEIGKYIKDVYFSFVLSVNTYNIYQSQNDIFNAQISVQLNVEFPTPFLDVTWSFNPSSLYTQNQFIPISFLTIAWQNKY